MNFRYKLWSAFVGVLAASLAHGQQPVAAVDITKVEVLTGQVEELELISGGFGYTRAPDVLFEGGGGTGAAAQARISGGVTGIAVENGGSGYGRITFGGGGGTGGTAFATITAGVVTSVTLLDQGSGYTSAPTVNIQSSIGAGFVGTATLDGDKIAAVTVTNGGTGYSPPVTISNGGGNGAVARANISGGSVSSITIIQSGAGYSAAPDVSIAAPPAGQPASLTATISGVVTGLTLTNPGTGYKNYPVVVFKGGEGVGATARIEMATDEFDTPIQNEAYGPAGSTIIVSALAVGTFPAVGYRYEFFVEGVSIGVLDPNPANGSPARFAWTPPRPGSYFISVKATGTTPTVTSLPIRYFAVGTEIVNPVNNTLVPNGSSVVVQAVATGIPTDAPTEDNAFVKRIDFYDGYGNLFASDDTYPYSAIYTPNPALPIHNVEARAFDSKDRQVSPNGTAVKRLRMVAPVGTAPTSVLSSPTHNSAIAIPAVGSSIPIAVDATSASGRITKVELYIDGVLHETTTTYPYRFTWSPSVVGTYALVALAYDDKNNVVSSAANTSLGASAVGLLGSNGQVGAISVVNAGSGYTTAPVVTVAPPGVLATATASVNLASGQVIAFSVTNGGAGYDPNNPPAVSVAPASGGVAATGQAVVDPVTRKVVSITLSSGGSLYTSSPIVTIAAPPASGNPATATASISAGKITGITVDNGGSGYVAAPVVTVAPPPANLTPGATIVRVAAPPTITITSPASGSTVTGGATIQVSASATDGNTVDGIPVTISSVQFFDTGVFIGSASAPASGSTYTVSFVPTPRVDVNGNPIPTVLTAIATNSIGLSAVSSPVTLNLTTGGNPPPPPPQGEPPVAQITTPISSAQITVGTAVPIRVNASDTDGNIVSVQFLVNGNAVGSTDDAYPYATTWTPANLGVYRLTAVATDNDGNSVTTTAVTVTVVDPSATPPTVAVTSPAHGVTVPSGVAREIEVSAADDVAVASVEVFVNDKSIGTDTTFPFRLSWTPSTPGVYRISARAADNMGTQTTSSTIVVAALGSEQTERIYSGNYQGAGEMGSFVVADLGGTATFIAYSTTPGAAPKTYYFDGIPVGSGRSFSRSGESGVLISGTFNDSGVSGTFNQGALTFIGAVDTTAAGSGASGYYTGSLSAQAASRLTGILRPSGELTVYISNGTFSDAGAGVVDASGAFSITTRSGNKLVGRADPATGFLTGDLTGAVSTSFTGGRVSGGSFSDGVLRGLSTRGFVSTGDNILIAGFVVEGSAPKQLLIRGLGPAMAALGTANTLPNPRLGLFDRFGTMVASNDNWTTPVGDGSSAGAIVAATTQAGLGALDAAGTDAVILRTVNPGIYTAQLGDAGGATGNALLEVYDLSTATPFTEEKVYAISTRGYVNGGGNELIAGFIITGSSPKKVLVQAVGPALPVPGALADPVLRIVQMTAGGQVLVRENNDWGAGNDVTLITRAAASSGANALAEGSKDAALLITLPPGIYTAVVNGAGNSSGIALVNVYEVR